MGKFKTKVLRPKKKEEVEDLLSCTLFEDDLWTSDSGLSESQWREATQTAEQEQSIPQLHDDPGIVKLLQNPVIHQSIHRLKGAGTLLSSELKARLGFGELGEVFIHTDKIANLLCSMLHAKAFALTNDIFFANDQFDIDSPQGISLLVHELSHISDKQTFISIQRQLNDYGKLKDDLNNKWVPDTREEIEEVRKILNQLSEQERQKFYTQYPETFHYLQFYKVDVFQAKQLSNSYGDQIVLNAQTGAILNTKELAEEAPTWLEEEIYIFLNSKKEDVLNTRLDSGLSFWIENINYLLDNSYAPTWRVQLSERGEYQSRSGHYRQGPAITSVDHGNLMIHAVFDEIFPAYLNKLLQERTIIQADKNLSANETSEGSFRMFKSYQAQYEQSKERRIQNFVQNSVYHNQIRQIQEEKLKELEIKYKAMLLTNKAELLKNKDSIIREHFSEENAEDKKVRLLLKEMGINSDLEKMLESEDEINQLVLEFEINQRMSRELEEYMATIMPEYENKIAEDATFFAASMSKPFLIPQSILDQSATYINNEVSILWKGIYKDSNRSKSQIEKNVILSSWDSFTLPLIQKYSDASNTKKQLNYQTDPYYLVDAKLEYLTYFLGKLYAPEKDGQASGAAISSMAEDNLKFVKKRKAYWESVGPNTKLDADIATQDKYSEHYEDSVSDIIDNYDEAITYLEDLLAVPDDDSSYWKNFMEGLNAGSSHPSYVIPFIGSVFEYLDLQQIGFTARDMAQGYGVSDHERIIVEAYAGLNTLQSRNDSVFYATGNSLPTVVSFMIEMYFTAGTFNAIKAGVSKATSKIILSSIKAQVKRAAIRNIFRASKVVGMGAAVVATSALFQAPSVFKNAEKRKMPVMLVGGEDGSIHFVSENKTISEFEALRDGFFDTAINNLTERLGEVLVRAPKSVFFSFVKKYPFLADTVAAKYLTGKLKIPSDSSKTFKNIVSYIEPLVKSVSNRAGVQNIPVEYLEEFCASVANRAYYNKDVLDFNLKDELNTLGVVALTGAILKSGSVFSSRRISAGEGEISMSKTIDGKITHRNISIKSDLLFRLEMLARTQPFSLVAAQQEIDQYRKERQGISYYENNVLKTEHKNNNEKVSAIEQALLDFYASSSPELEIERLIIESDQTGYTESSAIAKLYLGSKLDAAEMDSLRSVKGYEAVGETLMYAFQHEVSDSVLQRIGVLLGTATLPVETRARYIGIINDLVMQHDKNLTVAQIEEAISGRHFSLLEDTTVKPLAELETFKDERPYQASYSSTDDRIWIHDSAKSDQVLLEENAHKLLVNLYRYYPAQFDVYTNIFSGTQLWKDLNSDPFYSEAAAQSSNPSLYFTMEAMAQAISTRGAAVPEIAPSLLEKIILQIKKALGHLLNRLGVNNAPTSPEKLSIHELLELLANASINNKEAEQEYHYFTGQTSDFTTFFEGKNQEADIQATFYAVKDRMQLREYMEQKLPNVFSYLSKKSPATLLNTGDLYYIYQINESDIITPVNRKWLLENNSKLAERLNALYEDLKDVPPRDKIVYMEDALTRMREAEQTPVENGKSHTRFKPKFFDPGTGKEISFKEALKLKSGTGLNKGTNKLFYKYGEGNMEFEVLFDPTGKFPAKVIGKNLQISDLGAGYTANPEGKQTNAFMNAAHVVANMFYGSGYKASGNIIATSDVYNQKAMLPKEKEIREFVQDEKYSKEFSYFNLEVDITYENVKITPEQLEAAISKTSPEIGKDKLPDPRRAALGNPEMLAEMLKKQKELLLQPGQQPMVKGVVYKVTLFDKNGMEIGKDRFEVETPDYLFGIK